MVSFGGKAALPVAVSARATAAYVAGWIGNAIALVLYLRPLCTFTGIWSTGVVPAQLSVWPELAALLNGLIWGMGGLPSVEPGSLLSLAVNTIGVVCLIFYVVTFFCFAGDRCHPFYIGFFFEIIVVSVVASLVFSLPDTAKERAQWISFCGCITGTLTYALPASKILLILWNCGGAHQISLFMAAGGLASSLVWVVYSTVHGFNIYVFLPNVTGVVIGGFQVFICFRFPHNAPVDENERVEA